MKFAYYRSRQQWLTEHKKIAVALASLVIATLFVVFYSFGGTGSSHNDSDVASEHGADAGEAWYLLLVNKWNPIPKDYSVELTELSNGQSVDARIYPALQEMFDAARSAGIYPVVGAGYRTEEKQQSLMTEKIAEYKASGYSSQEATKKAEEWVALPGTSEHQMGIAVDINADAMNSESAEVSEWFENNAYRYGFILRYPPHKTTVTGVIYEPWHYRYVGVEAATIIHAEGICLEEYLET